MVLHLKICLIALYIEVKTSLCVKIPAGSAYTRCKLVLSKFAEYKIMKTKFLIELKGVCHNYLGHKNANII